MKTKIKCIAAVAALGLATPVTAQTTTGGTGGGEYGTTQERDDDFP